MQNILRLGFYVVSVFICFSSMIIQAAEPPLNFYYALSQDQPWVKVLTRAAACPLFESLRNHDAPYGRALVFTEPRLGGWRFPDVRYSPDGQRSFFCFYTTKWTSSGGIFDPNDDRYVGEARCGGDDPFTSEDGWYIDIKEERCVCASGLKTAYGTCVTSCPGEQKPIDGVCSGAKNNGPHCGNMIGNPINVGVGNKYQRQEVWGDQWGLGLEVTYNSQDTKSGYIGRHWRSNWDRKIDEMSDGSIYAYRPDGRAIKFADAGSSWISDPDLQDRLIEITDGSGEQTGWEYHVASNNEIETYDLDGRLLFVRRLDGYELILSYSSGQYSEGGDEFYVDGDGELTATALEKGLLVKVEDSLGREVKFKYGSTGNIAIATDVSGKEYKFTYDTTWRRLEGIAFPTSTASTIVFHYEISSFPHALTGITDENGNRYATWSYDSQGRAVSSEHANGVDKTTMAYNADGTTTVTNPLGKQTTYHFTTIQGVRKVTQVEGHPTASCEGANKSYQYDANGNVISKTDWNGVTTTYTYDMARNLELSRTEAVGTPQERIITTEWHAQFRLPTKISEPDRITEYTYDALGRQLSSKVSSVQ